MSNLILPRRFTQQPQGAVEQVDQSQFAPGTVLALPTGDRWRWRFPNGRSGITTVDAETFDGQYKPFGNSAQASSASFVDMANGQQWASHVSASTTVVVRSNPSAVRVLSGMYDGGIVSFVIALNTEGQVRAYYMDGGWTTHATAYVEVPKNVPVNLTAHYLNQVISLYVNGKEVARATGTSSVSGYTNKHRLYYCPEVEKYYDAQCLSSNWLIEPASDPWQIFKPRKQVLYFDALQAPAPATGTKSLVIPRRFTQQPQGAVEVDSRVSALVTTGGGVATAYQFGKYLAPNNAQLVRVKGEGHATAVVVTASAGGAWVGVSTQGAVFNPDSFALLVDFAEINLGTTDENPVNLFSHLASSGPLSHIQIYCVRGNGTFKIVFNITVNWTEYPVLTYTFNSARGNTVVGVLLDGLNASLTVNGEIVATGSTAVAPVKNDAATVELLQAALGNWMATPSIRSVALTSTAAIPVEWMTLSGRYGFFNRSPQVLYFGVTAGGTVPMLSFPFAINVTATSATPQVTITFA